jgi:CRP/FNR family transcriptional regulator, cyclic AMP receptor protein
MDEAKPFVKFIRDYCRGEIVFEEGSPGQEMYVIASGAVKLTTVKQGRETFLARMEAGEFFGEMALVDAAPRSGTVTADEEGTSLIKLDLERFLFLVQQQPIFALAIMHTLCDRIRRKDALYLELIEKMGSDPHLESVSPADKEGGSYDRHTQ